MWWYTFLVAADIDILLAMQTMHFSLQIFVFQINANMPGRVLAIFHNMFKMVQN